MKILDFLKASEKVLGLNARSLDFLRPLNLSKSRFYADNKLYTKLLLEKHDLPYSQVFAIIKDRKELENFDFNTLPNSFVVKPNRGIGGAGIIVAFAKSKKYDYWISSSRKHLTEDYLRAHINNILDGHYSLANIPDIVFIEERIKIHPAFKPYSYRGIPDIRIIVYNKVPVMAMLRLPTQESDGKANLNQGGIGVGIDIASGRTTFAIKKIGLFNEELLDYYPGKYKLSLHGIEIPNWNDILKLAIEASIVSGLGYAGVDIALDREKGPIILELNARPGLSIQNANLAGLKDRLARIKGLKIKSITKAINIAKNLFGGDLEHEVELFAGREIIGFGTKVTLIKKDVKIDLLAKVDTGADYSSIDREFVKDLGLTEELKIFDKYFPHKHYDLEEAKSLLKKYKELVLEKTEEIIDIKVVKSANGYSIRPYIKLFIQIGNTKFKTKISLMYRKPLKYKMNLGKKDLKYFLIDPNK